MKLEEQEHRERLKKLGVHLQKELEEASYNDVLSQATRHLAHMHSAIHFFLSFPSQADKQDFLSNILASAKRTCQEDLPPLLVEALNRMTSFVQDLIPEGRSDA